MPTITIQQVAVVPIMDGLVCLITNRSGQRWIVPKGMIDDGMTPSEAALQEAWEEAGLDGVLDPIPLGTFNYAKYGGTCVVTVFRMQVTRVATDWPERRLRKRQWLTLPSAIHRVGEPGVREMLTQLFDQTLSDGLY
jgi:8-oxo-dGTP pyrophosphatase MutT (NUDIX family)